MDLGLSLGDAPARPPPPPGERIVDEVGLGLGFCMGLGGQSKDGRRSVEPPLQLDLGPVPLQLGLPWINGTRSTEERTCGFDVNRAPWEDSEGAAPAAPNSPVGGDGGSSSRASDEDENGVSGRKKLRLSKEQSAFLEETFKEHHTLNPKQKAALANQLGLRPRQVEVWFQNRRARTKLKQTEVDCEYLKRSCETLTAENRRLQKELADLRALKTAGPYYMQLPATTLSMCPSCEKVSAGGGERNKPGPFAAILSRPRVFPFASRAEAPRQA